MAKKKGAVVIGVNRTGGLHVLESAAKGARAFSDWLTSEVFEVKTITDDDGRPVTVQQIANTPVVSRAQRGRAHAFIQLLDIAL
ncbi:MAG TPA: hypothetical protein VMS82_05820 [Pseudolabrys sp.]|jgi:hypothetical protein|nr:hypothetical protein [Pseudolabrys sp.]